MFFGNLLQNKNRFAVVRHGQNFPITEEVQVLCGNSAITMKYSVSTKINAYHGLRSLSYKGRMSRVIRPTFRAHNRERHFTSLLTLIYNAIV